MEGYIHGPINVSLWWISCMVGCMEGGYIHGPINVFSGYHVWWGVWKVVTYTVL